MEHPPKPEDGMLAHLRGRIFAGLLAIIPLVITILVLKLVVETIGTLLNPILLPVFEDRVPGWAIPVISIILLFPLLYIIGFVASNVVGKQLVHYIESALARIPVIGIIYRTSREVIHVLTRPKEEGFKRVVLVEFPRKGMWAVGFATRYLADKNGRRLVTVFIPAAPNPATGFIEIVEESETFDTEMTIEEAMKLVISAGILSPSEIAFRKRPPQ